MDKYDTVFDLLEHPEKYSEEEICSILSDEEAREIYVALSQTHSAENFRNCKVDIEQEWKTFTNRKRKPLLLRFLSIRAASIVIVLLTSAAAVALGFAVKSTVFEDKTADSTEQVTESACITAEATSIEEKDSIATATIITFEDACLKDVMQSIAEHYGMKINFKNKDAESLHIFYRLDTSTPIDEIIEQLNTFTQINIHRDSNTINIE